MPRTFPRRRLTALLSSPALVGALIAGTAQPAQAQDDAPLAVCAGDVEQTIDPGLTVLPQSQKVSVTGDFHTCTGQLIDPEHAFAEYTASATGLLSCTLNVPITNANGSVRWQDEGGEHSGTSHFTGGITLSQRPLGENVGIVVATINSGEFQGRTLVLTSARLTINPLQCLTSGVRRVAGPGALEILPL
ncbi:hypothetical protein [Streptomyces fulvorobeus]|uniref:Lipoprotein n=1 Tax=Streptomyces fulvorobeus TaxID=284028 RepID=A0A7J0CEX9_9ACTN|nr:hypothetical protein [Streptomyces fulvorobeus]NYE44518.1 hypothetical protein [Streptomyces fulvorobeus]GFN01053.1 hypothetical protein Sfulv_58630 [Streptomyces fulvorobeus]